MVPKMGKVKKVLIKVRDKLVGRVNLSEEQISEIMIGRIRSGGGGGWRQCGHYRLQYRHGRALPDSHR